MKATGYVRHVDHLGRLVLPIKLRHDLEIESKDDIEIYVDGRDIVLLKYRPACVLCGGHEELSTFKGKLICQDCRTIIAGHFGRAAD